MKVLHILNELRPSGAEVMLRSARPHWGELGVDCEILSIGKAVGPFAEAMSQDYRVHHLPSSRTPKFFFELWRFIRSGGYDVVHQHVEAMSFWVGLTVRAAGVGLVRTIHSSFQYKGALRWRRMIQRRMLGAVGVLYASIAPGVLNNERRRFKTKPYLIWNWLDSDKFQSISPVERHSARLRWGLVAQDRVIVSVGNCSPIKNHEILFHALSRLSADVKYLHIGVEDDLHSERQLASRLKCDNRTIFAGWLSDVRPALAAADVFVMPSKYEGLGIAALEALAVGIPTVLTRVDGLRDLEPLFDGLVFVEPDPASLAAGITRALDMTPQEIASYRDAAGDVTRSMFDAGRGAREYLDLYKRVSPCNDS